MCPADPSSSKLQRTQTSVSFIQHARVYFSKLAVEWARMELCCCCPCIPPPEMGSPPTPTRARRQTNERQRCALGCIYLAPEQRARYVQRAPSEETHSANILSMPLSFGEHIIRTGSWTNGNRTRDFMCCCIFASFEFARSCTYNMSILLQSSTC